MKKILAVLVIAGALVACNDSASSTTEKKDSNTAAPADTNTAAPATSAPADTNTAAAPAGVDTSKKAADTTKK